MNTTYFKFLFVTTIKKRPVWITLLLMLITCTMFIIVLPAVARMNPLQVWANTTMTACQSFFGMTIALFSAVLGIHIFQDGIAEGTELIILSKPIKRYKIILTKFFVFGTFCLLANLLTVIITCFTIFLPSVEVKFYWGMVISMLIGNAVTFMFYGAIAILLTVRVAKTGVIVVNILTSLILIIYQILTLVVFKIPARSLVDHGVVAPTYFLMNRNEDGSYEEDRVVKFGLTDLNPTLSGEAAFTGTHWQDVEAYWKNEILKNDPSIALNVTDIATQLSLSYLSYNVHGFSDRQAFRNFALSRHYDYTLTEPASFEVKKEHDHSLPWVYRNLVKKTDYSGKHTWYQPEAFCFAGISPASGNRLKGFGDLIPVGVYAPAGLAYTAKDVFLEKDEYNKYLPYFKIMYDTIFVKEAYNLEGLETSQFAWSSAWSLSNANLNTYYKRVWTALSGSSQQRIEMFGIDSPISAWTKDSFDISNIADLNSRFIQFKYVAALLTLNEQRNAIVSDISKSSDEEQAAYATAKAELAKEDGLYDYLAVKNDGEAFLLERDADKETPILWPSYVEENTHVPDTTLMVNTYNNLTTDAAKEASRLSTYFKCSSIIKHCSSPREYYLFNSITEPTRSADQTGHTYCIDDDWYSYWDTIDIWQQVPKGQNMQYFYFETKARVPYWMYAAIWATISMVAFAGSFILYSKYDFK